MVRGLGKCKRDGKDTNCSALALLCRITVSAS
jgi:hypothetical protein